MNIFLDMVGCRLNQSELEIYARQFRMAGHTLVPGPADADVTVINTCCVTAAAESDSRQKTRQAARRGSRQVIVTGCLATLKPREIASLPGVTQVIDNAGKDNLVLTILNLPPGSFDQAGLPRQPIPGSRLRTRAFIKVQDGCDNACTYCITRLARGPGRSRPVKEILGDVDHAVQGGCKEIVLTGVHLGSWGADFQSPAQLDVLIRAILNHSDVPRLRLSSIEPWDITAGFFDLWQDSRMCRHLHLPLQSGCPSTLKRMGRKITTEQFAGLVSDARQSIPGVAITTDIITGFPGETEAEFTESCRFVDEIGFANGHVFTFSPRLGTAAVNLPGQVPPTLARQRNARMRQIFLESATTYRSRHVGDCLHVLWDKARQVEDQLWQLSGLSGNYLRVRATHTLPCRNEIMPVRIAAVEQDALVGDIIPDR